MAGSTTSLANAIKQEYAPGVVEAVFYNDSLLGIESGGKRIFPVIDSGGDTAYRWHVHSSASTSVETFTEGQVQPTASNQSYTRPALSFTFARAMVQITGHSRDALRSQWFDAVEMEMALAQQGISDLFTTTFLNGTSGLQEGVDAGTTYAGIARGSASYFESLETAVSGVLAHSSMYNLHEGLRDNDRGANPANLVWLMPHNQITNYAALDNGLGSATRRELSNAGQGFDRGFISSGMSSMGRPIFGMPDMTDTVILCLDTSPGNLALVNHRGLQVKEMAPVADSDVLQVSMALALAVRNPIKCGKLTGVTA